MTGDRRHAAYRNRACEGGVLIHLRSCGFIFKGPGLGAARHRTLVRSPAFVMRVAGVATVEQAVRAAAAMVQDGAQLIELCGGFDETGLRRVAAAVGRQVPVGRVTFSGAQARRLKALLA